MGARAVIETRTPIIYLHYVIKPGGKAEQLIPSEYNAFAYVIEGEGVFGSNNQPAKEQQAVLFSNTGGSITIGTSEEASGPLSVLLIAGVPLKEPVVRYGPFVMNTRAEILQAIEDYNNGRMGAINS